MPLAGPSSRRPRAGTPCRRVASLQSVCLLIHLRHTRTQNPYCSGVPSATVAPGLGGAGQAISRTSARVSMTSLLFFFSSRRRHTRCSRDWSSDVCSSDLYDNNSDCCPILYFAVHNGAWRIESVHGEYGTFPASSDVWTRFAFDVFYSQDPKIGRASCRERV